MRESYDNDLASPHGRDAWENFTCVAISGALITNRVRQGRNKAWIGIAQRNRYELLDMDLHKEDSTTHTFLDDTGNLEEMRIAQDMAVSSYILKYLDGWNQVTPCGNLILPISHVRPIIGRSNYAP
jgi:hypothetical protein